MFDLIELKENICLGAPKLKDRRINVHNVVAGIHSEGLEIYLDDKQVSLEEARQAVNYCKTLRCIMDKPFRFCDGCTLRTLQDDPINIYDLLELNIGNDKIINDKTGLFLGDISEYLIEYVGTHGWKLAEALLQKYPVLCEP